MAFNQDKWYFEPFDYAYSKYTTHLKKVSLCTVRLLNVNYGLSHLW